MALYAFDGTWNEDEIDEAKETNVLKFCKCLPADMNVFYQEGVGTRFGFIGKLLGGLTGAGGRFRIHDAMERLDRYFAEGDRTIDIIGFSRGSALALHFANQVQEEKPGVEVRFLGLWDTVASFGIPGNDINIGWDLTLPDNVRHCFHAMALDERRRNFPLTRVVSPKGGKPVKDRLQEVWFRGVHSDVGGGQSVGLSSIALCWMLRRAKETGLPVVEAKLKEREAMCDPKAPISKTFDPIKDPQRTINATDVVHESVTPRGQAGGIAHNDPPQRLNIAHG
ncbi:MAG: DUF2235 domain-containing protein [Nitrospira sp.]|nr:DUF2235 domain-containing protein [Nitrospira sp.]